MTLATTCLKCSSQGALTGYAFPNTYELQCVECSARWAVVAPPQEMGRLAIVPDDDAEDFEEWGEEWGDEPA